MSLNNVLAGAVLSGVSCTSPTTCLVVGTVSPADVDTFVPYAVVGLWSGTTLTPVAVPAVAAQTELGAVSCTRANWCAAVGSFTQRGSVARPLVERWNGATLHRMGAPT